MYYLQLFKNNNVLEEVWIRETKSSFYLITDFQSSLDIQLIVTLTLKGILLLMQKMAISRQ